MTHKELALLSEGITLDTDEMKFLEVIRDSQGQVFAVTDVKPIPLLECGHAWDDDCQC